MNAWQNIQRAQMNHTVLEILDAQWLGAPPKKYPPYCQDMARLKTANTTDIRGWEGGPYAFHCQSQSNTNQLWASVSSCRWERAVSTSLCVQLPCNVTSTAVRKDAVVGFTCLGRSM